MTTTQLLVAAFQRTHGPLIGFIGLIVSVVSWVTPIGTETVTIVNVLRFSVPVLVVVLLLVFTLGSALAHSRTLTELPRVLHARNGPTTPSGSTTILLLLEPSDLFGHGSLVSVYHMDSSDFEELIGVGYVRNVQEDRKVQVLFECRDPHGDAGSKLSSNDAALLKRVKVKPSAPYGYQP